MTDIILNSPQITEVIVSNLAPYGAGPTGPQGPSGSQGASGPIGVTGATGAQGPTGVQGATGAQGATGVQGSTGPQGATGLQGSTGPVGATGALGATGIQGATGPQGATGIGTTGATGISGDRYASSTTSSMTVQTGSQFFTASAGLAWSIGQDMVIAHDITNQMNGSVVSYEQFTGAFVVDVLTITGSGTYSSWTINLDAAVGPQGATGIQGPQGPAGTTGATGIQGPIGVTGATGIQGPIGETGPIGITGATGVQGPSGSIGATGETGPIGVTGATGIQGPSGSIGETGATGIQGPVGETGPQGPIGVTGATGIQGPVGETGPQGATGIQGATGPLPDTSSFAKVNETNTFTATQIFEEDVTINATLVAERFYTKYISSSIIYDSGSTKFGDTFDDVHQVTGSLEVTGSFTNNKMTYPNVDGLVDQVIKTDGTGTLTFGDVQTILEDIYTGEAITKGDPLYISGSQGAKPIVYKADAADSAKMPVTYIAAETIGAANDTRGIVLGKIDGIDLTGYPAGTEVYVGVGGGWTSTRPTGSATVQLLGIVTKEGSGGQGLVLNPGPFDLPNLAADNAWIGDANGVPAQVNVGKFATTGSNTFIGDQTITGSLAVSSSIAIDQIVINDGGVLPIIPPIVAGQPDRYTRNIIIGNSASFATPPAVTSSKVSNIVIGADTMPLLSGSGAVGIANNIMVGHGILQNLPASGGNPTNNILIGNQVFGSASVGPASLTSTVAIGFQSLVSASAQNASTVVGVSALQFAKQNFNVAIGNNAMQFLGSASFGDGTENTAVGAAAGTNLISGSQNVLIGRQAGIAWRSGSNNVGVGYRALYGGNVAATGSFNTTIGDQTFQNLRTGSNNIAIGNRAASTATLSEGQLFIDSFGANRANLADHQSGSIIYGQMTTGSNGNGQILRLNAQTVLAYGATGSLLGDIIGTSSWASNAISSSFAETASAATSITFTPSTASFAETASAATSITFVPATASFATSASWAPSSAPSVLNSVLLSGSTTITGSVAGEVIAMTISSNTASFNAGAGSFYTLTLVSGSTTFVSASNIIPGTTMTLKIKQASTSSGSVRFASAFKFPTSSLYTASTAANAEDIISFITFDGSSIYSVATKQLS